jgi:hypothetical protein
MGEQSERSSALAAALPTAQTWLDDEQLPEREQVDRLAGDADLVATLSAAGFAGPDYDWVRDELVRYGVAVLAGWLKRGAIRGKCLEKRLRGVPEDVDREFDYDTAYELAGESVARALDPFREKVLIAGRWDPRKGASLKTFFVGQCLIQFVQVAKAWTRHELPSFEQHRELDPNEHLSGRTRSVEDDVIEAQAAATALADVPRLEARKALVMQSLQYTVPQIAAALGMTVKAVERMLEHARKNARETA